MEPVKKLMVLLWLFCAWAVPARAEVIDFAYGALTVESDGTQKVDEGYVISGTGRDIRRGIQRVIPIGWIDSAGRATRAEFDLLNLSVDDAPSPYTLRKEKGEVLIRTGSSDVLLSPGTHKFSFTWALSGVTLEWPDYQEVVWNGLGHQWDWPVRKVLLKVCFPREVEPLDVKVFLDRYGGERQADPKLLRRNGNWWVFEADLSDRPAGTGVTLAFKLPKGSFTLPPLPWWKKIHPRWFAFLALGAMVIGTVFWRVRFAKDAPLPVIVPQWTPDRSPALSAVDYRGSVDGGEALSLNLLALAAKGAVDLRVEGKKYTLAAGGDPDPEAYADEAALLERLPLTEEHQSLKKLKPHLRKALDSQTAFAQMHRGPSRRRLWASKPLLLLWLAACLFFFILSAQGDLEAERPGMMKLLISVIAVFLICLLYVFKRCPLNEEGARRSAQALGLRQYLSLAEKDRLNLLNPPELTPRHFELLMPYAYALGVEQQWSRAFAEAMQRLALTEDQLSPLARSWADPVNLAQYSPGVFGSSLSRLAAPAAKSSFGGGGSRGGFFGGGGFSGGGSGGGGGSGW